MLSESILAAAKPTREVVEINYQKLFSQQLLIYEPLERAGKLLTSKELKIYETKQDIKYSTKIKLCKYQIHVPNSHFEKAVKVKQIKKTYLLFCETK